MYIVFLLTDAPLVATLKIGNSDEKNESKKNLAVGQTVAATCSIKTFSEEPANLFGGTMVTMERTVGDPTRGFTGGSVVYTANVDSSEATDTLTVKCTLPDPYDAHSVDARTLAVIGWLEMAYCK